MGSEWETTTIGDSLRETEAASRPAVWACPKRPTDRGSLNSVGEVGYGSLESAHPLRCATRSHRTAAEYLLVAGNRIRPEGAIDRRPMSAPEQAGWFLGPQESGSVSPTCTRGSSPTSPDAVDSCVADPASRRHHDAVAQPAHHRAHPDRDTPTRRAATHRRHARSLDDKIELNGRMSKTLGSMASAFFKSWFVDFDPVRRSAGCGGSRLPRTVSDLFPGSLGDLRDWVRFLRGWRVGTDGRHPISLNNAIRSRTGSGILGNRARLGAARRLFQEEPL